jgi:hypothetical protein
MSTRAAVAGTWLASFVLTLATYRLLNDHFDRISRGRQIAAFGDLPFRDFFDPGYFMTAFASAAMFRIFGDRLIGEALLNAAFIASGAAIVLVLARRVTRTWAGAMATMALTALALPRAYDYDKFFFYPLGVLLCWRYVETPGRGRLVALAAGVVAAGLFRYDTGVLILCASAVAVALTHLSEPRRLAREIGTFALALAVLAAPFLLFIQAQAGLGTAIDQVVTYARRESTRFRLETPAVVVREFVRVDAVPPRTIGVRWAPGVTDADRKDVASRYSLRLPTPDESDEQTWSFAIDDVSQDNLRALVGDPRIEDTRDVDRSRHRLPPEPTWTEVRRALPLLGLRAQITERNANAILNYVFLAVPLVAIVLALRLPRSSPSRSVDRTRLLALAVLCLLLDLFILRPVEVRGPGIVGPTAVLLAWCVSRARGERTVGSATWRRIAVLAGLVVIVWSEAVTAEWGERVWAALVRPSESIARLSALSMAPPPIGLTPSRIADMATYVRSCTSPADRVFASWFVPELFTFAQRGFAGGMVVTFSRHWSEDRFERQIVRWMDAESVPLLILDRRGLAEFRATYPLVWQHLGARYRSAGEADFGNPDSGGYQVWMPIDRAPTGRDPRWGMPCFVS